MSYDTNSTQAAPNVTPYNTQIPFSACLRVVPYSGGGRRLASTRNLQLLAKFVEDDLVAAEWNIAIPVAYKPQYGNTSAQITLEGFVERDEESGTTAPPADVPNFAPVADVQIMANGTIPGEKTALVTGNVGGSLSWGQNTTATLDTLVSEIVAALKADSVMIDEVVTIDRITVMGVAYGRGGRSLPV